MVFWGVQMILMPLVPIVHAVSQYCDRGSKYGVHFRKLESYPCKVCDKEFSSFAEYAKHMKSHGGPRAGLKRLVGLENFCHHVFSTLPRSGPHCGSRSTGSKRGATPEQDGRSCRRSNCAPESTSCSGERPPQVRETGGSSSSSLWTYITALDKILLVSFADIVAEAHAVELKRLADAKKYKARKALGYLRDFDSWAEQLLFAIFQLAHHMMLAHTMCTQWWLRCFTLLWRFFSDSHARCPNCVCFTCVCGFCWWAFVLFTNSCLR